MAILAPILPFLAWIFSAILTILDWIAVRDLILDLAIKATEIVPFEQQVLDGFLHKWVIPAVDGFGVLLCGIVAFGLVLAAVALVGGIVLAVGLVRRPAAALVRPLPVWLDRLQPQEPVLG